VPTGSEAFVKPRRSRAFGAPASIIQLSTLPSGFFTSMWIHACGLIHSMVVTVPVNFTAFDASYSAAKEWCATTGTAASSRPTPVTIVNSLVFIGSLRFSSEPHETSCDPILLGIGKPSRKRGTTPFRLAAVTKGPYPFSD
jgi:hypothetical protein